MSSVPPQENKMNDREEGDNFNKQQYEYKREEKVVNSNNNDDDDDDDVEQPTNNNHSNNNDDNDNYDDREQPTTEKNNDNVKEDDKKQTKNNKKKSRQWLYDRSNGTSKDGGNNSRPPLPMCWVPPCVKLCPDILEQNTFCENIGEFQCPCCPPMNGDKHHKARTILMSIGFISNIFGLIFSIVACFGISHNYSIITSVPYSKINAQVTLYEPNAYKYQNITILPSANVNIDVALDAVAFTGIKTSRNDDDKAENIVYLAKDYCDISSKRNNNNNNNNDMTKPHKFFRKESIVDDEQCMECAEHSTSLIGTVIIATVTYLPSLFTNITRMYYNYDINCQKSFAIITTLVSILSSLYTWQGYINICLKTFPTNIDYYFDIMGNPTTNENEIYIMLQLFVKPGTGLIMIITATFIKMIDIIVHFILPTPSITRNHYLQLQYEKQTTT